ncbi:MAG: sulfite exporter TauE/SafE family protein [Armatimonadota bacterium]
MWTAGVIVALVLSAAIGLSLGLVGGGGSIITVPILVYVAGLPVPRAVALSLAIVGATSAVGAVLQAREGQVHLKAAAVFAVTGMVGALGGARLTPLVPAPLLMGLFALLMIAVGLRMVRGQDEAEMPARAECRLWKCGLAGLGLGVLTGFLGVGGGFLIVPALLRFAKLSMRQAVATSLLIIAANSASGFLVHLGELQGTLALGAAFIAVAIAGMLGGLALARRTRPAGLKVAFGRLSLAVAAFLLVMNAGPLWRLLT